MKASFAKQLVGRHPFERPLSWLAGLLLVVVGLAMSGCSAGGGGDSDGRLRLLNVSLGYDSLDAYVTEADNDDADEDRKAEGVTYGTISSYASLDPGEYDVEFRRTGVSSTLLTRSDDSWSDDQHWTYVAYGTAGHFGVLRLSENYGDADSGEARLLALNAADAGALDVYVTEDSVDLDDATPQFSNLGHGSASSSPATIDSGTYRIRITGTGDVDDVRLDISGVEFGSKDSVALILTETEGGFLVGMTVLPEEGSPTFYANPEARIRAAVAVDGGRRATVAVGSTTLVSSAVSGTISNRYTHVASGTPTISVTVDGAAVSVPSSTLAAGGDYTVLVWNDTAGVYTTLLSDDNHLPDDSGGAKLRIINGLSELGVAVSLSADYSPIAEDIAVGTASDYAELDGGSEYQLDVTNTDTSDNLFTRSGVTLQDDSVYTLFISGGTTVAGTLRSDRDD